MGADRDGSRPLRDVADGVGDGESVILELVSHPRLETERITGLGLDRRSERHRVGRPRERRVERVLQQAVDRVVEGGLGDVELLRLAVQHPLSIAHAIRPRHEHDSAAIGGLVCLAVRLDDVNAFDAVLPQACGALHDDRGSGPRRAVVAEEKLFAVGQLHAASLVPIVAPWERSHVVCGAVSTHLLWKAPQCSSDTSTTKPAST